VKDNARRIAIETVLEENREHLGVECLKKDISTDQRRRDS